MRFPILVGIGRTIKKTFFHLRLRPAKAFLLSDVLMLRLENPDLATSVFTAFAQKVSSSCFAYQVDWSEQEQERLSLAFSTAAPCVITGDSWTLPLLFALDCTYTGSLWPKEALASGAIRSGRGMRCVSIGGGLHKARYCQTRGIRCFLPQANINTLRRRGIDTTGCISLPYNLKECLTIWRSYREKNTGLYDERHS